MTLAIQWGYGPTSYKGREPLSQGFIYFDAVTAYRKSYSGSVSKHPIDRGGLISDHFTIENPVITMSAVISAVDISIGGVNIKDMNGNTPTNRKQYIESVKVNSDDKSLVNYLPNVAGQFFTPMKPGVVLAPQPTNVLQQIQELLESLFTEKETELVTLYEYEKSQLKKSPTENLVMTSLVFNETPESGEGLFCEITLEQVTFVNTRKANVPEGISSALVAEELDKKAATLENEGKQDSTPRGVAELTSNLYSYSGNLNSAVQQFIQGGN